MATINRSTFFNPLAGLISGLIGAFFIALAHIFLNVKFWGNWFMDAISVFVLLGGGVWVVSIALYTDINTSIKDCLFKVITPSFYAALVPGIIMAGITIFAAWAHNPGETIHNDEMIDWSHLIFIGLSWLVFVGGAVFISFSFLSTAIILLRRKFN